VPPNQSNITDVRVAAGSADLRVAWDSTDPAGTDFQVYVDRRLAYAGTGRAARLPAPAAGRPVAVDVVAVLPGERHADFSASLPAAPGGGDRARLWWYGGAYLGDVARYDVYGNASYGGGGAPAGGGVSFATPVGTVAADPLGQLNGGGAGCGPCGTGGAGACATVYSWLSRPLAPGTWNFSVVAVSPAGAPGPAASYSVTVAGPPRAPAPGPDGRLLTGVYSPSTRRLTLGWLAPLP
jgi:hypothetical protein